MEDRVKKSLWIITVIAALLIPIICFIVTVNLQLTLLALTVDK
jgi:hypothetical protein